MSYTAFDIIGPIMIGPSSSHTAGAVRLGQMARIILNEEPAKVKMLLHGSFAETFKGHGTNLALTAGLLGMSTADERIPCANELAHEAGIEIQYISADLGDVHPNSVRFELVGRTGRQVTVTGSSVGGGKILVNEIDDFPVELTGEYNTLITVHQDQPGVLAQICSLLAATQVNIAQMRVFRDRKGAQALAVIETDEQVESAVLDLINRLHPVIQAIAAKPVA
ncbi:MAG TPA: L-serine ammonia-lyase, iron-sulfur-dependent subunit beta [Desulfobacteria bacterium]|nr:L-serine ammonia-lyase, iron-sulfur-dependent subunit beta [Desulfobacteria bacterium]